MRPFVLSPICARIRLLWETTVTGYEKEGQTRRPLLRLCHRFYSFGSETSSELMIRSVSWAYLSVGSSNGSIARLCLWNSNPVSPLGYLLS